MDPSEYKDELKTALDYIVELRKIIDKMITFGSERDRLKNLVALEDDIGDFFNERGYWKCIDGVYHFDEDSVEIQKERRQKKEKAYADAIECPRCAYWKQKGMGNLCPDHDTTTMSEDEKEFA